jgi:hypothetical protein
MDMNMNMNGGDMPPSPYAVHDMPEQHAFVMAGSATLYLCHLTMLHMEGHMYQVVLRVVLNGDAMAAYLKDAAAHPGETYFLGNRPDDLMTVPDLGRGARTGFIGTIWRGVPDRPVSEGWPWDGHDDLIVADRVEVTLAHVVQYKHFDFNQAFPDTLTYLMFGSGGEAHLYHQQTKIPDFDSVVSLSAPPAWLAPELLDAGVPVNFPQFPSRPNGEGTVYCNHPIVTGRHQVQYGGPRPSQEDPADPGPQTAGFPIDVGRTLWFNTKVTNLVDPCGGKGDGGGG